MRDRLQKLAGQSKDFKTFLNAIKKYPRFYLEGRLTWNKADLERFFESLKGI